MDIRNCSIIALRIPRIIAARAPEKKKQQNDLQDSEHLVQLFRYLCPKSSVIYRNRSVVFTEHFDSLGQIRLCTSFYDLPQGTTSRSSSAPGSKRGFRACSLLMLPDYTWPLSCLCKHASTNYTVLATMFFVRPLTRNFMWNQTLSGPLLTGSPRKVYC